MLKRFCGRKRHIVTDTPGFVLAALVQPANMQDSHGAVPLLFNLRRRFPKLRYIFADRIYRGQKMLDAMAPSGRWTIQIVVRPPGTKGFQLLPKRWDVACPLESGPA